MGPEDWWEGARYFKSLERFLEAQHKDTWLWGSGAEIEPMGLWPSCVSWLESPLLYTVVLGRREVVLRL